MTRFLTQDEVLIMHEFALARDGGLRGVRDEGALESALAQPSAEYFGTLLHPTLEAQAAAYFYHLIQAHAFVDGNKRTGVLAATTFLILNGRTPRLTQDEAFTIALETAQGRHGKDDLARWFL